MKKEVGLGGVFLSLVRRDFRLFIRRRGEFANPLLFYVIIISLLPLGIGPESQQLRQVAPGAIWIAALLATLLALEMLFRSDYEDGSLEQMILSPHPTSVITLAKIGVHWLTTGLPLLIVTPLLAFSLHLDGITTKTLILSLLLGTPTLSLIGAVGAALTLGLQRGGLLLTLVLLPLYVPVLIFGSNAVQAAASGLPAIGQLYMLGAILASALVLAPIATAAALRISVN